MAAEVVRILKDREAKKRMSEAGPRWVAERFSRERMVEEYYRFFNSFLEQPSYVDAHKRAKNITP
jgi:glycosyltransferase involved in cell wall biosynthesis